MRNRIHCIAVVSTVVTLLGATGCSYPEAPDLHLAPKPAEELTPEVERLQQMQMVRGVFTDEDPCGQDPTAVFHRYDFAWNIMQAKLISVVSVPTANPAVCNYVSEVEAGAAGWLSFLASFPNRACTKDATGAPVPVWSSILCDAQTLREAGSIRAKPLKVDGTGASIAFPPQTTAARAGLLHQAKSRARQAAYHASQALRLGCGNMCSEIATSYVEAYHLFQEIADEEVEATLATADAQRSLSSSIAQGVDWAISGTALSRTSAAHALVGGEAGLRPPQGLPGPGTTPEGGFCTAPELTPQVQKAITVIREAAPWPAVINTPIQPGTGVGSMHEFLVSTSLSTGSLRARLGRLPKYPEFTTAATNTPDTFAGFFGLKVNDFAAAREYLTQEIRAFSRSFAAQLNPTSPCTAATQASVCASGSTCTANSCNTHPERIRWAATANPPQPLHPVYWATVAGYTSLNHPRPATPIPEEVTDQDLSTFVDSAASEAGALMTFVNTSATVPAAEKAPAQNVLATIVDDANQKGRRRVDYCRQPTRETVWAYGYVLADGLAIARGEDGLRCAVNGNIEGAPCSFSSNPPLMPPVTSTLITLVPASGFTTAVQLDTSTTLLDGTRIYLVKPRVAGQTGPGDWEVISGDTVRATAGSCNRVSVLPYAQRRAADTIAPSRQWCTQSDVECDGTHFDERMPLENELSDDGDNVESSWKHYLALARQAADEADALGTQYINDAIAAEQRSEELQLREFAKQERVESVLAEIQDICGTDLQTDELMALLGGGLENVSPPTPNTAGGRTYTQTAGNLLVLDSQNTLLNAKDNNQDLRRLWECIGTDNRIQFATLGSVPVCFSFDQASNQLCVGEKPENCPVALTAGTTCPANYTARSMVELKYFDTDSTDPPKTTSSREMCKSLRLLRNGNNTVELDKIRGSTFFNSPGMDALVRRIGFEPRFGAYGAVTVDGIPRYSTGDYWITRGVNSPPGTPPPAVWPCAAAPAGVCPTGGSGLFCSQANCAQASSRGPFNERLMKAVIALHATSVTPSHEAFKNVFIPVYVLDSAVGWPTGLPPPFWPEAPFLGWQNARADGQATGHQSAPEFGPLARIWRAVGTPVEQPYPETGTVNVKINVRTFEGIKGKGDGKFTNPFGTKPMTVTVYEMPTGGSTAIAWVDSNNTWMDKMSLAPISLMTPAPFTFGIANAVQFKWEVSPFYGVPLTPAGGAGWYKGLSSMEPGFFANPNGVEGYYCALLNSTDVFTPNTVPALSLPFTGTMLGLESLPAANIPPSQPDSGVTVPYLQTRTAQFPYNRTAMMDGLELACEIGNEDPTCDPGQMPQITADNLAGVSRYVRCVASSIQRKGATAILRDLPERAVDALRKESVNGAYPALGGQLGEAVTKLRGELSSLPGLSTAVSTQLGLLADDVDSLKIALKRADIAAEVATLRGRIERAARDAACMAAITGAITSVATNFGSGLIPALGECGTAAELSALASELAAKEAEDAKLGGAQALIQFRSMIRTHAETLNGLSTQLSTTLELVDGSLTSIDRLRNNAAYAVRRALFVSSQQADNQEAISTAMQARRDIAKERYRRARKNAVLMAFLARRSIEQRLGVRLSEMRQDFPLVGAPATWASTVCSSSGIDYSQLTNADGAPFESLADAFIGDYVSKLENFVESYRLTVGFHEGSDTAVVSLRDDIQNVRSSCPTPSKNLLYRSGSFDELQANTPDSKGWYLQNNLCRTHSTTGALLPDCVSTFALNPAAPDDVPFPMTVPELGGARGFEIRFGKDGTAGADCATVNTCGLRGRPAFPPRDSSAIAQTVRLPAGKYVLSWYESLNFTSNTSTTPITQSDTSAEPIRIRFEDNGTEIAPVPTSPDISTWRRFSEVFDVAKEQNMTFRIVQSLDTAPARPLRRVAAFMLEDVTDVPSTQAIAPQAYVATGASTDVVLPVCEDTNGEIFRRNWDRNCVRLCADGFSTNCGDQATTHCYWETSFHLSQWAIEKGGIMELAGFARGNFNYRMNSIGLNFVGTNTRECEGSNTPSTCFGGGFIPYSIAHVGPYFVRNHEGKDECIQLFEGNIEHARGLATERYLTNPFSDSDRGLIDPYLRKELVGRPLDGTYVVRVWEEPGVNFDAVKDVQIVMNYSYWTRFN